MPLLRDSFFVHKKNAYGLIMKTNERLMLLFLVAGLLSEEDLEANAYDMITDATVSKCGCHEQPLLDDQMP